MKEALQFLKDFSCGGGVQLTAINPLPADPKKPEIKAKYFPTEEGRLEFLEKWNGKWNLYFTPNPLKASVPNKDKKPSKNDMAALAWVQVDIDPVNGTKPEDAKREALEKIKALNLPPTFIIDSGNGIQAFWRLKEPILSTGSNIDELEGPNKEIMEQLGADSCTSLDHVFRVPFTINLPTKTKLAKGRTQCQSRLLSHEEVSYSFTDFPTKPKTAPKPIPTKSEPPQPVGEDLKERFEALLQKDKTVKSRWEGDTTGLKDTSRSAMDMSMVSLLKRRGFNLEECRVLLDGWKHGKVNEKGPEYVNAMFDKAKGLKSKKITIRAGAITEIVDEVESILLENGIQIYQRAGELIRPVKLDQPKTDGGVMRPAGATVLLSVVDTWLVEQMGLTATWVKTKFNSDGEAKEEICDPPTKYARTLLGRAGEWKFSFLRGILTIPTLDRDGRGIENPGFDPPSGLLLDFQEGTFPKLPSNPTKEDAKKALDQLAHPFRGFKFKDNGSRSVALSTLLTGLIRKSLNAAPLHAIDAPNAGEGKTKLAQSCGFLINGILPAIMNQGAKEEEDEKRLFSTTLQGDPIILLDNFDRAISGAFLCSMLTSEIVKGRILGESKIPSVPSNALILVTGNNLSFVGDITRRVVKCRLDSGMEQPDERKFDFDVHKEILDNRHELVIAGLTVLKAFHDAGRPLPQGFKPMGSFEEWSWVRGALIWLGEADPYDTREEIIKEDPRKNDLLMVVSAWDKAYGRLPVSIGELANVTSVENEKFELKNLLESVVCKGEGFNTKRIGWWMRANMDRVVAGKCFKKNESKTQHTTWELKTTFGREAQEAPM